MLFDFFFFAEAVDLLWVLDFLALEERSEVVFLRDFPELPVDLMLSRLTILLKLLVSPSAVLS